MLGSTCWESTEDGAGGDAKLLVSTSLLGMKGGAVGDRLKGVAGGGNISVVVAFTRVPDLFPFERLDFLLLRVVMTLMSGGT